MLIKFNNFLVTYDKHSNWVSFRICSCIIFCCEYDLENLGVLNIFIDFLYITPNLLKRNGYQPKNCIYYKFTTSEKSCYYFLNKEFLIFNELNYIANNNFDYYCKIYIYFSKLKG